MDCSSFSSSSVNDRFRDDEMELARDMVKLCTVWLSACKGQMWRVD